MNFSRASIVFCTFLLITLFFGCETAQKPDDKTEEQQRESTSAEIVFVKDHHSYANPEAIRVTNVDLDWDVSFETKSIKGTAELSFERGKDADKAQMILDTRDLKIGKVEASNNGGKTYKETTFKVGEADKFLGSPLTIDLPPDADRVKVTYQTSPTASGLQWLTPEQTAGKKMPFMFSQAQAIHARSFIPLQDSPQVRITYSAKVRTSKDLLALMSAEGNSQTNARTGEYEFKMPKAIPSYLIAIAVGDLKFKSLGKRSGVYSEPSVVEKAAKELEDTEKMIDATEKLYGEYMWGRYDLLVLPPSFPFGGMENPMLTFATPTILAGDKSLVSLVAHELAHSWSGNLVTNSTWRDFWLNEGFTTYLTYRITEAVYGEKQYSMEAMLGRKGLEDEIAKMDERDQILHVDLTGRDPDDGFTGVPYEKGALFLRYLEEKFGRDKFDEFLKTYFRSHAFQSITTEQFVEYLKANLLEKNSGVVTDAEVDEWINKPGLPKTAPLAKSDAFEKIDVTVKEFLAEKTAAKDIPAKDWTTQEWLHFLRALPSDLGNDKMAELDAAFNLTKAGNSEIIFQWLVMSIDHKYAPADGRLEEFLTTVGRRKFVKPLFEELVKTPAGKVRAAEIYKKARSGYHPITAKSVDEILDWKEDGK